MKITIDTKEDSSAEIRKVITLLSKLIEGSSERHSNIFEDSSPSLEAESNSGGNAFANMFGGGSPSVSEDDDKDEEEEKEETPRVMEY